LRCPKCCALSGEEGTEEPDEAAVFSRRRSYSTYSPPPTTGGGRFHASWVTAPPPRPSSAPWRWLGNDWPITSFVSEQPHHTVRSLSKWGKNGRSTNIGKFLVPASNEGPGGRIGAKAVLPGRVHPSWPNHGWGSLVPFRERPRSVAVQNEKLFQGGVSIEVDGLRADFPSIQSLLRCKSGKGIGLHSNFSF
jgi:hypothetical protein